MTQTARQELGVAGERLARRHLEQLGYQFITANWRRPHGELDLIMRDGEVVVFVEVKTRRGQQHGAAEESVTPAQSSRLLLTAESFLSEQPELAHLFWRVDLIAVTLAPSGVVSRLTHVVDAIHTG